ncbi:hypothetical protein PISMIDRAFT_12437 [Pisolithus microcarpus 441]|uniref:Uncharacterized protein n=1 Tax=Pisolithus microcarpus 441 TaxID=765257 RepID=A0A0C9YWJ6_9AGAM|nr:hypothetical protein PISMIDRAFT_12437 [Pisolithus microcarpus 441]
MLKFHQKKSCLDFTRELLLDEEDLDEDGEDTLLKQLGKGEEDDCDSDLEDREDSKQSDYGEGKGGDDEGEESDAEGKAKIT